METSPLPIQAYLEEDHRRLEALLDEATADPGAIRMESYREFRAGLLRHIGIEEKVLLAEARRRLGGPHPLAHRLRVEHGAIASLLVPTPDHALLAELRTLLVPHNELEEGGGGVYAACERLFGEDAPAILEAVRTFPTPKVNAHYDGPRAHRTARAALEASAKQRFS
jgi:hypothetical protein